MFKHLKKNPTPQSSKKSLNKTTVAWLASIGVGLFANMSFAFQANFVEEANLDERAIFNGTTEAYYSDNGLHTGGLGLPINITFSAQGNGPGPNTAYAYLDAYSGDKPGGLGVCSQLPVGGSGNDYPGPGNECLSSSDDNITSGESLTLSFDFPVDISGLTFRDKEHDDITNNASDTLLVNGERMTFFEAATRTFSGTSITFAYDDQGSPRQFYLNIIGNISPVNRLGDRVWEDLNADGIQNCTDTNANGIIGDSGDTGPECSSGIAGVPVELYAPDASGGCTLPMGLITTTDANGFYAFDELAVGDYCVKFDLNQLQPGFCDTDGQFLGSPSFTGLNVGDDLKDSDATPEGTTAVIALGKSDPSSSNSDLSLDAGVVCPGKLGDYVWLDTDSDGTQNELGTGIEGVEAQLYSCGPDGVKGTADDEYTGQNQVTDTLGFYSFGGDSSFELSPGCYYVRFNDAQNREFTLPNQGSDDNNSDCEKVSEGTAQTGEILIGHRDINNTNDCGLVESIAVCDLSLVKKCYVKAPTPPPAMGKCKGKLREFSLSWHGKEKVSISGPRHTDADGIIHPGDQVTFLGPFKDNDVYVHLSGKRYSVFHMSCSDDDFNGPEDCNKLAGNGKKNDSRAVNDWRLQGFVDGNGQKLSCSSTTEKPVFSNHCTYVPAVGPSCENSEKPKQLVFEYLGGGCAASDNDQGDKSDCRSHGKLSGSIVVHAAGDDDFKKDVYQVKPKMIQKVGDRFTISNFGDKFKSDSFIKLKGDTGIELNEFHTSCSRPLAVGDQFGSLKLVGWNGVEGGQEVSYRYRITNHGDALEGIKIKDDQLGLIANNISLNSGESRIFRTQATITGPSSSVAVASTELNGELCLATSNQVTVKPQPDSCELGVKLDKVDGDKLKLKITNKQSAKAITLKSLKVHFTKNMGDVKEIKLDGTFYKKKDAHPAVIGMPASFDADDWTKSDKKLRQIGPGKTEKLEIKTTRKGNKYGRFLVELVFGPGCHYLIEIHHKSVVKVQKI